VQFLPAEAAVFSFAANYRPFETDGTALVTVNRSGNTSGTAQVDYTT
jgi:hypothetical protein